MLDGIIIDQCTMCNSDNGNLCYTPKCYFHELGIDIYIDSCLSESEKIRLDKGML